MKTTLRNGLSRRAWRSVLVVSLAAIVANGARAQEGERPCPDPDADLQLILQDQSPVEAGRPPSG